MWNNLPTEVIIDILYYLDIDTLFELCSIKNTRLNDICKDDYFWKMYVTKQPYDSNTFKYITKSISYDSNYLNKTIDTFNNNDIVNNISRFIYYHQSDDTTKEFFITFNKDSTWYIIIYRVFVMEDDKGASPDDELIIKQFDFTKNNAVDKYIEFMDYYYY